MQNFEMNAQTKRLMDFFNDNYAPFTTYHLNKEIKIFLGSETEKVCRFCNKNENETTFSTIAHAIPEFIGNKKLIANYECDACNSKFSRLLESHMGNYMNLWHTLSQVKGKRSVPSFKTINDKSRIDIGSKNVEIAEYKDDKIISVNPETNTITFTAKKRSYVPIAVYKTLTKMALTIMPESELIDYKTTMAWINEENHQDSPQNLKNLIVFMSIAGGIRPIPFVSCMLFKRKDDHKNPVPNMLFVLAYSNFVFQIYLPLSKADLKLQGGVMELSYCPTFLDLEGVYLTRKKLNMSGKEKVVEEEEKIEMQFEHLEHIPGLQKTDKND
ncbi:HNH endonuclease [Flavobacterium sp.]|uniref:HNH endonuclease n=1 Tax=Flavobacterium sp. TaxID=239 RepID=UPI0031D2087D